MSEYKKLNNYRIEKDWLKAFPTFTKDGTRSFIKRHDYFLIGIYLYPISRVYEAKYRVEFYVYNLLNDLKFFDTIPLTSNSCLEYRKGVADTFSMEDHNNDFANIVKRLKNQIPLLKKKTISNQDVIDYMRGVFKMGSEGVTTLTNIILAYYWSGNSEQAEKEIENGKKMMSKWEERLTKDFGGLANWEKQVRNLMNKEILEKNIETQIERYNLKNLKNYELNK